MACPAGTHFLPVSPTLDDVRCHRPAIYLHDFDRFGDGFWNVFLGTCQDFSLDSQLDSFQDPLVFLNCTLDRFYLPSILGWLAAPLILTCRFGLSVARGTQILAGGIGVARFVAGAFLCFLLFPQG